MYINFWYPVGTSDQITAEEPFRAKILSLNFVAFRDSDGTPHVLSDTCVHRGGALGKGVVKDDCIACPYHGWQYDGNGKCRRIPSINEGDKISARAKIDSYPVAEKYGIVFAFLGDAQKKERPPIWDITEYDRPDWRANKLVVFEVDYYYERSIENGLDAAHNEFVHPNQGAPGMGDAFRDKPIEVEDIPWGSQFEIVFARDEDQLGLLGDVGEWDQGVTAGSAHMGPNAMLTWIKFTEAKAFHQYFFEAPIDDKRTRIFFLNMRHFMLEPEKDDWIVDVNMQIAKEDIAVLTELNPTRTPETNTREILTPSDRPVVRYREYLKEWDSNGWRIDRNKLQSESGDVAYAIPCPDRRTAKNWVLEPIPTLQPGGGR